MPKKRNLCFDFLSVELKQGNIQFKCKLGRFYAMHFGSATVRLIDDKFIEIVRRSKTTKGHFQYVNAIVIGQYIGYSQFDNLGECFEVYALICTEGHGHSKRYITSTSLNESYQPGYISITPMIIHHCASIPETDSNGNNKGLIISKHIQCRLDMFSVYDTPIPYRNYGVDGEIEFYSVSTKDSNIPKKVCNMDSWNGYDIVCSTKEDTFKLKCISIWPIVRLLWIANKKEDRNDCPLARLPRDIMLHLSRNIRMQQFDDYPFNFTEEICDAFRK